MSSNSPNVGYELKPHGWLGSAMYASCTAGLVVVDACNMWVATEFCDCFII